MTYDMTTYLGYNLLKMFNGKVNVYDPRFDFSPVYVANDFASARSWVRAYRDGAMWAVNSALGMHVD